MRESGLTDIYLTKQINKQKNKGTPHAAAIAVVC